MGKADLFKKLRLDDTKKALVIHAPKEYETMLDGLVYDTKYVVDKRNKYDFIQVFVTTYGELEGLIKTIADAGKYDCLFWICYPKGGGKIKSDIKRDKVWNAFALINLRPVTQIAIDDTWSAMRGRPEDAVGK